MSEPITLQGKDPIFPKLAKLYLRRVSPEFIWSDALVDMYYMIASDPNFIQVKPGLLIAQMLIETRNCKSILFNQFNNCAGIGARTVAKGTPGSVFDSFDNKCKIGEKSPTLPLGVYQHVAHFQLYLTHDNNTYAAMFDSRYYLAKKARVNKPDCFTTDDLAAWADGSPTYGPAIANKYREIAGLK